MSSATGAPNLEDDGPEEGEIEDDDDDGVAVAVSQSLGGTSSAALPSSTSLTQEISSIRIHSYERDIREFEKHRSRTSRRRKSSSDTKSSPRTLGTSRGNDPYMESPTRLWCSKDRHYRTGITEGKENRHTHHVRDKSLSPTKKNRHGKESHHRCSGVPHHSSPPQRDSSLSSIESENRSSDRSRRQVRYKRLERSVRSKRKSSSSDLEPIPAKHKPHHNEKCPLMKVLHSVAKETRLIALESTESNPEESSLKKRLLNMGMMPKDSDVDKSSNVTSANASIHLSKHLDVSPTVNTVVCCNQPDDSIINEVTIISASNKPEPEVVTLTDSEDNTEITDQGNDKSVQVQGPVEPTTTVNCDSAIFNDSPKDTNEIVIPACQADGEDDDITHLRQLALQSKKNGQTEQEEDDVLQLRVAALRTAIQKKYQGRRKGKLSTRNSQTSARKESLSYIDGIPLPASPAPADEVIMPVDMDLAETESEDELASSPPSSPARYSPSFPTESPGQEVSLEELLPPPPPSDLPLDFYSDSGTECAGGLLGVTPLPISTTPKSNPLPLLPPPFPIFFQDLLTSECDNTSAISEGIDAEGMQECIGETCEPVLPFFSAQLVGQPNVHFESMEIAPLKNQIVDKETISPSSTKNPTKQRPNLRKIPLNQVIDTSLSKNNLRPQEDTATDECKDVSLDLRVDEILGLHEGSSFPKIPHEVSEIYLSEGNKEGNKAVYDEDEKTLRKRLLELLENRRRNQVNATPPSAEESSKKTLKSMETASGGSIPELKKPKLALSGSASVSQQRKPQLAQSQTKKMSVQTASAGCVAPSKKPKLAPFTAVSQPERIHPGPGLTQVKIPSPNYTGSRSLVAQPQKQLFPVQGSTSGGHLKENQHRQIISTNAEKNSTVALKTSVLVTPKPTSLQSASVMKPQTEDTRFIINLGEDSDSSENDYSEAEALGKMCSKNKEVWLSHLKDYEQSSCKLSNVTKKNSVSLSRPQPSLNKGQAKPISKRPVENLADLESSVERFLKGVRSNHDAAVASSSAIPSSPGLKSVAVLPASQQAEYRRLKQEIAQRELQMKLKKQSSHTNVQQTSKGIDNKAHLVRSKFVEAQETGKKIVPAPKETVGSRTKELKSLDSLPVKKSNVVGSNQTLNGQKDSFQAERKQSAPKLLRVTVPIQKSTGVPGTREVLLTTPSPPVTRTETNQCTAPGGLSNVPDLLITVPQSNDSRREVILPTNCKSTEDVSKSSNASINSLCEKAENAISLNLITETNASTNKYHDGNSLTDLEAKLLSGRNCVLEDLSGLAGVLTQVERSLDEQCDTAEEVKELLSKLSEAAARWKTQNETVTGLVSLVAQRQKDLSLGHKRCVTVSKACTELGKQLCGKPYRIPSGGGEEMRTQLRLVHEKTQLLANRRRAEQNRKKALEKQAVECLSKLFGGTKDPSSAGNPGTPQKSEHCDPAHSKIKLLKEMNKPCSTFARCGSESTLDLLNDASTTQNNVLQSRKSSEVKKQRHSSNNVLTSKGLALRTAQNKVRAAKSLLKWSKSKGGKVEKNKRRMLACQMPKSVSNHSGDKVQNIRVVNKVLAPKQSPVKESNHDLGKELSDMDISSDEEAQKRNLFEVESVEVVDMAVSPDLSLSPGGVDGTEQQSSKVQNICEIDSKLSLTSNDLKPLSKSHDCSTHLCGHQSCDMQVDSQDDEAVNISATIVCGHGSLEKNETLGLPKPILKNYISPLASLRTSSVENSKIFQGEDLYAILCPYDLNGRCQDNDCRFKHQQ